MPFWGIKSKTDPQGEFLWRFYCHSVETSLTGTESLSILWTQAAGTELERVPQQRHQDKPDQRAGRAYPRSPGMVVALLVHAHASIHVPLLTGMSDICPESKPLPSTQTNL